MTSKIDKIKALAKEGKGGERTAAIEALRRLGVPMDIMVSSDQVTLIPMTMGTPSENIYAPSKTYAPITILRSQLPDRAYLFWVSLSPDKRSNPKQRKVYKIKTNYWIKQEERIDMFNDQETIKQVLSQAENIYSIENNERVMLVYQDDRLYHTSPGGGLAFKPISDAQSIVHIEVLNAWQVTWTV